MPLRSLPSRQLTVLSKWRAWGILMTALTATTVAALTFFVTERSSLVRALETQTALQSALMQLTKPPVVETQRDFTADLPLRTDMLAVLSALQRSCAAAGVNLQEVRVDERKPSARELGLVQLTLQLRGTFPAIKQVLIEVQGHFATLTVRRLELHRSGSPSREAEGTTTLAIWARPLTLPPTTLAPNLRARGRS